MHRTCLALLVILVPWFALFLGFGDLLFDYISDNMLSNIAAGIELLTPLGLVIFVLRTKNHSFRSRASAVLGATLPAVLAAIWLLSAYLQNPVENAWAFSAAWLMGFFLFLQLASFGIAVAILLPKSTPIFIALIAGMIVAIIGLQVSEYLINAV